MKNLTEQENKLIIFALNNLWNDSNKLLKEISDNQIGEHDFERERLKCIMERSKDLILKFTL